MDAPLPSTFEILKIIAMRDGVYKEGDTMLTLQKKLQRKRHQGRQTRYLFNKNQSPKNLPPTPEEFSSITICALRYAHSSIDLQIVEFCIAATTKNWDYFSSKDKTVLRCDTEEAIVGGIFRVASAIEQWKEFDRWLKNPEQQVVYPPKDEVYGLGLLTIYALRYCVGRMTYMPGSLTDATKKNWHLLNRVDRQTIQQDTIEAIATRHLGMDCDRETWLGFNEWITEKLK